MFDWPFKANVPVVKKSVNFSSQKISVFGISRSVFPYIWTEYRDLLGKSPYSVRMLENADQKNSEYGHILRNVYLQCKPIDWFHQYGNIRLKRTKATQNWQIF